MLEIFVALLHNALVFRSNLAEPILKASGIGEYPVQRPASRSHLDSVASGKPWYKPEPQDPADLAKSHLVVPDAFLDEPFQSIYGFAIPEQIRLQVVATHRGVDHLERPQRELHERMARIGHGLAWLFNAQDPTTLVVLDASMKTGRFVWNVAGVATCPELGARVDVEAFGIRGHKVPLHGEPSSVALASLAA